MPVDAVLSQGRRGQMAVCPCRGTRKGRVRREEGGSMRTGSYPEHPGASLSGYMGEGRTRAAAGCAQNLEPTPRTPAASIRLGFLCQRVTEWVAAGEGVLPAVGYQPTGVGQ